MRGTISPQGAMFFSVSLEERVPQNHPLRKLRLLIDAVLGSMDAELAAVYPPIGRPSIPPEQLLKAPLPQILFTIRSECLLVESLDFNLLYRWFVGLSQDAVAAVGREPVGQHTAGRTGTDDDVVVVGHGGAIRPLGRS